MDNLTASIGILAHNEGTRIEETLRSLFKQDVFQQAETEVVIVANGCTDNTAAVARRLLEDHRSVWESCGSTRVEEIRTAGKANAWNRFVHEFSSSQSSMLILMDADIKLLQANTISSMIDTLARNPQAVVCVDLAMKDIQIKSRHTFFERLLVAATPKSDSGYVPLCGQLYCAVSADLRLIKLPPEITVDDGFIRALLLTRGFTQPEDPRRIVRNADVAHSFSSVSNIWELFKHEKWIVVGSIVNMLLFQRLSAEASPTRSAMGLMEEWQKGDPAWLSHYVEDQVCKRGWRLLPRSWWSRRWLRLKGLSTGLKMRRLPVAAMAAAVDYLVFVAAIRDVRRGHAFRYWKQKEG